ncbi:MULTISPECIES: hypothetical protein [Myroides]|uniref:DUF6630 domain-containing protein n=1 Tax=Myroides albus TaxID=2562892 RepID=A0A6I3LGZ4_9FLAO|nr:MULTISPECIES: hypothetical protein [Myroides]MTG97493.1 hypothetical protein [Myroides albus]MVX35994.1 hypothetical protein [Myroides sp. LoEW2-1]UVD81231.1 hypothetical protein NWE55_08340 [Myroides albus]
MKKSTYFLVLLLLVLLGIGTKYFAMVVFSYHFSDAYWFGVGAVLVTYIWSKKDFTGKPWFLIKEKSKESTKMVEVKQENLQVDKKVLEGFKELIGLSVPNNKTKDELIIVIDRLPSLPNYHEEFIEEMDALRYVSFHCNEEAIDFIISLDWKERVDEFIYRINSSLDNIWNITIKNIPTVRNYPSNGSVNSTTVFKDVDVVLRQHRLQLGFFDVDEDCYKFFVHRVEDKDLVRIAVEKIGYNYFEWK